MNKTELLAALHGKVASWPGHAALTAAECRDIHALHAALGDCFLSVMEQHFRSLSDIWSQRTSRCAPDPWLKDQWLATVSQWREFVAQSGIGKDSRPEGNATARTAPPFIVERVAPEPGHLPFGFVKQHL
jgi:hypothetical protein